MEPIAQMELRLDELAEAIQRSGRLMTGGKFAAIAGAALLLALAFGAIRFSPNLMMIGVCLGLGGIVLMGSSKSSTELLESRMRKIKTDRDRAIDSLNLVSIHSDD